jgi:DNA-directed RNA polymerase subunit RPC12/RpoP
MSAYVCVDCHTEWDRDHAHRAGWTFLFFPWNLIFAEKRSACPECKGKPVSADSERGKLLAKPRPHKSAAESHPGMYQLGRLLSRMWMRKP